MFPFPLRASTLLNPSCTLVQGVFIEAFLTTFLVFTIIVLTVERTKVHGLELLGMYIWWDLYVVLEEHTYSYW
ncbi:hypothetical protein EON64_07045 [archaeon]|nr:MAG: hypothetical protein EON64_07045 [archaeon]